MTCVLAGIGFAVPPLRIDRETATRYAKQLSCNDTRQEQRLDAVYRKTGVDTRGSVLLSSEAEGKIRQTFFPPATSQQDRGPTTAERSERFQQEASRLAIEASRSAISDAGVDVNSITHLVVVTCTGFASPGVDIDLIDELSLPLTTQRVQVGFMGCHAAVNGLRVAGGLLASDPDAVVLMCCVELCSLHYQYGYDANRIVSGALFADGAASMILRSGDATTTPRPSLASLVDTGSYLVPDSRDAMTWIIGDYGFEMTLAATVPGLIEDRLVSFLKPWLSGRGFTIDSIGGWAVHPGGARILTAVESALGLDPQRLAVSREVLSRHGNMSSATMPAILQRFIAMQMPKPWVMLGFGPGLEIEVGLWD